MSESWAVASLVKSSSRPDTNCYWFIKLINYSLNIPVASFLFTSIFDLNEIEVVKKKKKKFFPKCGFGYKEKKKGSVSARIWAATTLDTHPHWMPHNASILIYSMKKPILFGLLMLQNITNKRNGPLKPMLQHLLVITRCKANTSSTGYVGHRVAHLLQIRF